MSVNRFFTDGVTVIIFIVLIVGIIRFKSLSKELRLILYFVGFGGFTEIITDFYKANVEMNTMPVGHFYITISIFLMSLFFREVLAGHFKKWIIDFFILIFISFSIINSIFIQSLHEFPNILGATGAIVMVVFSILLFTKIMAEAEIKNLWLEPIIWINIAILFYYAGNFFFYILFNLNVKNSHVFSMRALRFYQILNMIFYIFIGISFIKAKNEEKAL